MARKVRFARGFIASGFWLNCLFLVIIDLIGLRYVFVERNFVMLLLIANFNLLVFLAFYYAAWRPRRRRRRGEEQAGRAPGAVP